MIYDVKSENNEEDSALFAEKIMKQFHISDNIIIKAKHQIIATKFHLLDEDMDTNFFTDADLSILGSEWNHYADYSNQIRKEYVESMKASLPHSSHLQHASLHLFAPI